MIRRPPRSTQSRSSAASDVYKRQAVSRAHTTITSAMVPLPIQRFSPSRRYPSPSGVAVVSSVTASEPWAASVRANAPSRSSRAIPGSQTLLLLLRAEHPDGAHGQPRLDSLEGAQAAVAPIQLHVDQTGRHRAHRRASVADDAVTDDVERAHLLDQLPGELSAFPVAVDDRRHLGVDELAGALEVAQLGLGQFVAQTEVVGPKDLPICVADSFVSS